MEGSFSIWRQHSGHCLCFVFEEWTKANSGYPQMAWPVLVNKQKVEWMIKFLVANNDWYRDDDVWFSLENFGQLFHTADKDSDIGILQCMQVECDQQERQDI